MLYELNHLQDTLNGIKYEMKIQRNQSHYESMTQITTTNQIKKIIKSNLNQAQNGKNIIKLNILESEVFKNILIKKVSVEMLLKNIIILTLKNTFNGIVGLNISKDDF